MVHLILLGAKSATEYSLHVAAAVGNIEAVKQHLAAGADVNTKGGPLQVTPLHIAADQGHKEIVELLITNGADVNAKNKFGKTPMHHVYTYKRYEINAIIRKHGGKTGEELKAEGK